MLSACAPSSDTPSISGYKTLGQIAGGCSIIFDTNINPPVTVSVKNNGESKQAANSLDIFVGNMDGSKGNAYVLHPKDQPFSVGDLSFIVSGNKLWVLIQNGTNEPATFYSCPGVAAINNF